MFTECDAYKQRKYVVDRGEEKGKQHGKGGCEAGIQILQCQDQGEKQSGVQHGEYGGYHAFKGYFSLDDDNGKGKQKPDYQRKHGRADRGKQPACVKMCIEGLGKHCQNAVGIADPTHGVVADFTESPVHFAQTHEHADQQKQPQRPALQAYAQYHDYRKRCAGYDTFNQLLPPPLFRGFLRRRSGDRAQHKRAGI